MVHNGKSFNEITIQEAMIGHKFGEFALTRKKPMHKKKDRKKIDYGTKNLSCCT